MQHFTNQLQMQLASEGASSDDIHHSVTNTINSLTPSDKWSYLDLGCGNGELIKKVNQRFNFQKTTAVDGHVYTSINSEKVRFIQANLEELDESQFEKYDLITCVEVFEHLENPWRLARKINSLLSPGGHLIVTTPNPESIRSLLSFLTRGYHCAFGARNRPAHKTVLAEYDFTYLLKESIDSEFTKTHFIANGLIPMTALKWSSLLPFFKGKRFSDNYLILIKKRI